jgi:hypothetical protein
MALPFMQFFSSSRHFLSIGSKCSPHRPILKHYKQINSVPSGRVDQYRYNTFFLSHYVHCLSDIYRMGDTFRHGFFICIQLN